MWRVGMDVLDVLKARRTIFKFNSRPVSDEMLKRIFEFGLWAPNHHVTEPWRFVVLGETTKETLARRYGDVQQGKASEKAGEDARKVLWQAGYDKFISKPTIVAVSCVQEGDEQRRREDYAAVCCAMQNVQLAAWELGVGMQWSTGPITMQKETYELLDVDPDREYIIGFFYMGYPSEIPFPRRKPLDDVMRWTA